jgi:hypothetical protein
MRRHRLFRGFSDAYHDAPCCCPEAERRPSGSLNTGRASYIELALEDIRSDGVAPLDGDFAEQS